MSNRNSVTGPYGGPRLITWGAWLNMACSPRTHRRHHDTTCRQLRSAAPWRLFPTLIKEMHSTRAERCHVSVMSEDDSDSDLSEGARAARDRLAPKTQRDYSGYINELVVFACANRAEFADCMSSPTAVTMPVALKLGKAFVCSLRDRLISWPMDSRPEGSRTYVKHYSKAKINNACLAIKHTFRQMSLPIPEADAFFYSDFAQAYINILARDKACGAFPGVEGTVALGFAQIKKIINAAFR